MDHRIDTDPRISALPPVRFDSVVAPRWDAPADVGLAAVLFVGPRAIGADLTRTGRARVVDHIPPTRIAAHLRCQTAFKRDPRSASKRDPLFG